MIYISERIVSTIGKEESPMRWNLAETSLKLPESFPMGIMQDTLISPAKHVKCSQPGRIIRDSVKSFCIGGWAYRQSFFGTYQNFRFLEGKQIFSLKCMVRTLLKSKFPDPSQRLTSQAGFLKDHSWDLGCLLFSAVMDPVLVPLTVLRGTVGSFSRSPEFQSSDKVSWGPHSSQKDESSWCLAMLPRAFEDANPKGEHKDSQR